MVRRSLNPINQVRHVRIEPQTWNGEISMRLELYGTKEMGECMLQMHVWIEFLFYTFSYLYFSRIIFIYLFIYNIRRKTRQIPIVQMQYIQGTPQCNAWRQIYLRSPVLDAGGKTGVPGENLWKQVWTGNQMHIRRQDWESNPGPIGA